MKPKRKGSWRRIPGLEAWPIITGPIDETTNTLIDSERIAAEHEALEELPWLSDRAAALVASTMLEIRIEAVLTEQMVNHDQTIMDFLFGIDGRLGDFRTKIRLAYALGLFSSQGRKDLECISKIRNRFAHQLKANSFESDLIGNLCLNIKLIEQSVGGALTEDIKNPRSRFFLAIQHYIVSTMSSQRPYF